MQSLMQQPKIIVQRRSLPEILNEMAVGGIQVPRFQRDFVWPLTKTRALLDSMFKEFPIGTFFLWHAPVGSPALSRPLTELGIPQPQQGSSVTYILDGQQRLTSLFVTINGTVVGSRRYGSISVDLDTATRYEATKDEGFADDIFVYRSGDNERYVEVHDLVDPTKHLAIYNGVPDKWKPAFNRANQLFHSYPFSIVLIQEQTLADAIEIFQRINQAGKPLSRYDLICANVWTQEFDFRRQVEALNKEFSRQGFGRLHETIFTQTFALILKDSCTTANELSIATDEIIGVWDRAIRSLQLAVDFARANLGIKSVEYLPYRGVLPVLAYYFYHAPSSAVSAKEREALWSWFWHVTLSERYSSTSPSRMAEDAERLLGLLDGGDVAFDYPSRATPDSVARTRMTSTSSALRGAVLCLLALRQPRSFKDSGPVNLGDSFFSDLKKAERHHIFPVGYLDKRGRPKTQVHQIPNFCFIPADLNREIGSRAPSDYLAGYREANPTFDTAMASHLLPIASGASIWYDDYDGFLRERAGLIADELNRLAGTTPDDLVPMPAPMPKSPLETQVDAMEIRLRDFIDHRLTATIGQHYWKQAIPPDVRDYIEGQVRSHIKTHPYEDIADYQPSRSRLNFCTLGQLQLVFGANRRQFSEIFEREDMLQRYLLDYTSLRNAMSHNREVSDIEMENGCTAMKWLSRVLDKYDVEHPDQEQENGGEPEDED